MSYNFKEFGNEGEKLAADHLMKNGYKILFKNYRYGKGEIDIVAKQNDTLVFVEVKSRKNLNYGAPEFSITQSKIKQIKKIAKAFLFYNKMDFEEVRFDAITIVYENNQPILNHITNAF